MKRFVVLLLILGMLLMLAGCKQIYKSEPAREPAPTVETIERKPSDGLDRVYDANWAANIGYYEEDVLSDKEVAEAVAQQIFDSIKGEFAEDYVLQYTTYYEAQNAWMVYFDEPWIKGEMVTLGGGCTIALNKSDGRVMRIFWWE